MISKKTNEEPVVQHENAVHLLGSIKLIKHRALKANEHQLIARLDELLPTKPILLAKPIDNSNPKWMKIGFPTFNSSYRHIRGQRDSTDKDQRSGRGAAGLGCSVTFPTPQQTAAQKRFKLDSKKMNSWFSEFKSDPTKSGQRYFALRNELWAYFIAFYGSDTLTHLWYADSQSLMDAYKTREPQTVKNIRSAYFQELKMIDYGYPFRMKPADLEISDEDLKCILRGYATSRMIILETDRAVPFLPIVEFEIGRFRYPTLGFKTIEDYFDEKGNRHFSASEIHDLGNLDTRFLKNEVSLGAVVYVLSKLIERKKNEMTEGLFRSEFREPVDALFIEYYDEIFSNKFLRKKIPTSLWDNEEKYFFRSNLLYSIPTNYGFKAEDFFDGGLNAY